MKGEDLNPTPPSDTDDEAKNYIGRPLRKSTIDSIRGGDAKPTVNIDKEKKQEPKSAHAQLEEEKRKQLYERFEDEMKYEQERKVKPVYMGLKDKGDKTE